MSAFLTITKDGNSVSNSNQNQQKHYTPPQNRNLIFGWFVFLSLVAGIFWTLTTQTISSTPSLDPKRETLDPKGEILHIVQSELPHEGVLIRKEDGYIYLKVDDNYIHDLYPLIHLSGFRKPHSLDRPHPIGAHISVFYENEGKKIGEIKELKQIFKFTPEKVLKVKAGKTQWIVLQVQSAELENLRKEYGFSPFLQDHPFHISIAQKRGR